MDDLFKDMAFLGGTPLDSITTTLSSFEYLSTQIESQRMTVNHLPESKRILHNGTVRVFVRTKPNITQWSSLSIRQNHAWFHTINR